MAKSVVVLKSVLTLGLLVASMIAVSSTASAKTCYCTSNGYSLEGTVWWNIVVDGKVKVTNIDAEDCREAIQDTGLDSVCANENQPQAKPATCYCTPNGYNGQGDEWWNVIVNKKVLVKNVMAEDCSDAIQTSGLSGICGRN